MHQTNSQPLLNNLKEWEITENTISHSNFHLKLKPDTSQFIQRVNKKKKSLFQYF